MADSFMTNSPQRGGLQEALLAAADSPASRENTQASPASKGGGYVGIPRQMISPWKPLPFEVRPTSPGPALAVRQGSPAGSRATSPVVAYWQESRGAPAVRVLSPPRSTNIPRSLGTLSPAVPYQVAVRTPTHGTPAGSAAERWPVPIAVGSGVPSQPSRPPTASVATQTVETADADVQCPTPSTYLAEGSRMQSRGRLSRGDPGMGQQMSAAGLMKAGASAPCLAARVRRTSADKGHARDEQGRVMSNTSSRVRAIPGLTLHEDRLDYIDGSQRIRSASLLFVGSVLGFLGFTFAAFLGFYKLMVEAPPTNFRLELMKHSYFPATVSEMVYDKDSPQGKVFFAFVLAGAICMLSSWYPLTLRNVYVGNDVPLFKKYLADERGVQILMLRQFLPAIGMLIVACVPTKPAANRSFTDSVTCSIHTTGAVMSIGGYAAMELWTLLCAEGQGPLILNTEPPGGRRRYFGNREKHVRMVLITGCVISVAMFQVCGIMVNRAAWFGICCTDAWEVPTDADWELAHSKGLRGQAIINAVAATNHQKLLLHPASGVFLAAKLGCYTFEVLAGLFMLASHLAIWYFCPERFVDLPEKLVDPLGYDGFYDTVETMEIVECPPYEPPQLAEDDAAGRSRGSPPAQPERLPDGSVKGVAK